MFGTKRTKSASAAGLATETEYEAHDDYLISLVIKLNKMHEMSELGLPAAAKP